MQDKPSKYIIEGESERSVARVLRHYMERTNPVYVNGHCTYKCMVATRPRDGWLDHYIALRNRKTGRTRTLLDKIIQQRKEANPLVAMAIQVEASDAQHARRFAQSLAKIYWRAQGLDCKELGDVAEGTWKVRALCDQRVRILGLDLFAVYEQPSRVA